MCNVTLSGVFREHTSGELGVPPKQLYPNSILQSLEQPSLSLLFPSSHSRENLIPSPHLSIHESVWKSNIYYGLHCVH